MPPAPVLTVRSLSLRAGPRTLVLDLELQLQAGEFWCLLGPNGAGKTTLLAALAGLLRPAAGQIELAGRPLHQWRPAAAACVRGFLPQHGDSLFGITALQAALLGRHPHVGARVWDSAEDLTLARDALQRLQMLQAAERDIGSLSGGERQRVALACLLTQDPLLYLLDEPLTHLDLHHQVALMALLREQACGPGRAVLASTHDLSLAARFASHALLLSGSGAWSAGPVADLMTPEHLSRAFGHPVRRIGAWPDCAFVAA